MAVKTPSAVGFVPETHSIRRLRQAAAECRGCELFRRATQTVFGEGPAGARLMLVGETPGDQEDLAGRPFVGAAGRLLDDVLAEADIERKAVYVTNAVKHFKWTQRGTRRLHAKPSAREVSACRPWLEAEIAAIEPELIVCLGATAAGTLLGREFRLTRQHGVILRSRLGPWALATFHPSAVLRAPDEQHRQAMRRDLLHDLQRGAAFLAKAEHGPASGRK